MRAIGIFHIFHHPGHFQIQHWHPRKVVKALLWGLSKSVTSHLWRHQHRSFQILCLIAYAPVTPTLASAYILTLLWTVELGASTCSLLSPWVTWLPAGSSSAGLTGVLVWRCLLQTAVGTQCILNSLYLTWTLVLEAYCSLARTSHPQVHAYHWANEETEAYDLPMWQS